MIDSSISQYRHLGTLCDGTRVLLRPLNRDDKDRLVQLFSNISPEDRKYIRQRVEDPAVVASWVENLDLSRTFPLVAVIGDRIVGDATLHLRPGPGRHIADVRVFLAREYRHCGLGSLMLKSLIEVARKFGLQQLQAEIVTDQSKAIKAFQNLGFQQLCILEDYFMFPDGETQDVALMILYLKSKKDEF